MPQAYVLRVIPPEVTLPEAGTLLLLFTGLTLLGLSCFRSIRPRRKRQGLSGPGP